MKRVIITGPSGGLASAFAKKCISEGIEVIGLGRTQPDYECKFIKTDLRSEESMKKACDEIKSWGGGSIWCPNQLCGTNQCTRC